MGLVVYQNDMPAESARAKILNIQAQCQALPDGERMTESPPLIHWSAPGIYAREIHLPAGSMVVGRIHRFDHLSIISQGRVSVYTEDGMQEITAPATFLAKAGTKRVVYTHEACIWTTIHPNPDDEPDFSKMEQKYTAGEYAELGMAVATELLT